jgi:hypothetical protein
MRWTYFEKDNWYYAEVWFIFRDGKVVESGVK